MDTLAKVNTLLEFPLFLFNVLFFFVPGAHPGCHGIFSPQVMF